MNAVLRAALATPAWSARATLVDAGPAFVHADESIPRIWMWDYLHLTAAAYETLGSLVDATVAAQ